MINGPWWTKQFAVFASLSPIHTLIHTHTHTHTRSHNGGGAVLPCNAMTCPSGATWGSTGGSSRLMQCLKSLTLRSMDNLLYLPSHTMQEQLQTKMKQTQSPVTYSSLAVVGVGVPWETFQCNRTDFSQQIKLTHPLSYLWATCIPPDTYRQFRVSSLKFT